MSLRLNLKASVPVPTTLRNAADVAVTRWISHVCL